MNIKNKVNREIPFLEDFSIKEINEYLNIYLNIIKQYCGEPFEFEKIRDIIKQIRNGKYPGFNYTTIIKSFFRYSDFEMLFNRYIEENNLNNFSFFKCKIILYKLISGLEKISNGLQVEDGIINVINNLKSYQNQEFDNNVKDIVNSLLNEEFGFISSEVKVKKYKYFETKENIIIFLNGKLKSFNLIKRLGEKLTILKDENGKYFLRKYMKKPLIEIDENKGVYLYINIGGNDILVNLKINKELKEILITY